MDQSSKPCPSKVDKDKAVPEKLLEECWFFSNLLDKKIIMSKNTSDSCTSSNCSQHDLPAGKSYEETYESIKKLPRMSTSLTRAPSMPPRLERKHSNIPITKGRDPGRRRSKDETSSSSDLASAPSLPMSLGAEDVEDEEEIEFSMGKLIRQASLKTADALPLTIFATMGPTTSSSSTSRRKQEFDSQKLERLRPRRLMSQLKTQKSLSDLHSKELQGIKDLGLQGQKRTEDDEGNNRRRPQDSAPAPVPEWGGKTSKEEDMKAQIKFWARAVASNVR